MCNINSCTNECGFDQCYVCETNNSCYAAENEYYECYHANNCNGDYYYDETTQE